MAFKKAIDLKHKERVAKCLKERINPAFHPIPNTMFRKNDFRNIPDELKNYLKNMSKVMKFYNDCLDLKKKPTLPQYLVLFVGHIYCLSRLINAKDKLFVLEQIDDNPDLYDYERAYIQKILEKLYTKLEKIDGIVFVSEEFSDYTNESEYTNHYIKIVKAIEDSLDNKQRLACM